MSIQKEIILRYRSAGHLRFALPAALCSAAVAPVIEAELHRIDGVYRVNLYRRQAKLSIRFFDTVTAVPEVAMQMQQILHSLEEEGLFEPHEQEGAAQSKQQHKKATIKERLYDSRMGTWVQGKYQEGKETVTALKVLAKRTGGKNGPAFLQNPERTVMEFGNDILVLYLIKKHWQQIMTQWLPYPLRHRYEWLAVIYMTYLWVHWRHKKD